MLYIEPNYVQQTRGDLLELSLTEALLTNHIGFWITLSTPHHSNIFNIFVVFPFVILFAYAYRNPEKLED